MSDTPLNGPGPEGYQHWVHDLATRNAGTLTHHQLEELLARAFIEGQRQGRRDHERAVKVLFAAQDALRNITADLVTTAIHDRKGPMPEDAA